MESLKANNFKGQTDSLIALRRKSWEVMMATLRTFQMTADQKNDNNGAESIGLIISYILLINITG